MEIFSISVLLRTKSDLVFPDWAWSHSSHFNSGIFQNAQFNRVAWSFRIPGDAGHYRCEVEYCNSSADNS